MRNRTPKASPAPKPPDKPLTDEALIMSIKLPMTGADPPMPPCKPPKEKT